VIAVAARIARLHETVLSNTCIDPVPGTNPQVRPAAIAAGGIVILN